MEIRKIKLYTYQWKASHPVGASVLIIHGLGEHAGRYRSIVNTLNEYGIDVYSFDLPGHGKSPGKRGHIASFEKLFEYIGRYLESISGKKVILGHSLGGLIALRVAEEYPDTIEGIVASSPAIHIKKVNPLLQFIAMLLDKVIPSLTMSNQLNPKDISRSQEEVNAYINDPLVHDRISARLYGEMVRNVKYLWEKASHTKLPLLLQVGENDNIVPPHPAVEFARIWGGNARLIQYPGAYHELYEDPYIGKQAISDVLEFIRGL